MFHCAQFSIQWISTSHLSKRAWSKGYYWYSKVYVLPWPHLEIDNGGILKKLYDKRDDFTFPIVNFPFISSHIPVSPAYGVYILQLIRYSRACAQHWFSGQTSTAGAKTTQTSYVVPVLKSSLQKYYGLHHNLVDRYEISISQMAMNLLLIT